MENECKHELSNDKQGMYVCAKCGISMEKKVQDEFDNPPQEIPGDPEKYREYIRGMSFLAAKKDFDFETIFKFCQDHRVEVLMQDDTMYHCFIDWHLPEGKGSWAVEFDGFTSLILGINEYIRHDGKSKNQG